MSDQHWDGMGAIVGEGGVAFRVWAPNAESVAVMGTFNDWKNDATPLTSEGNGYWYAGPIKAKPGDEYQYWISREGNGFSRRDPYGYQVTNSVGNTIVYDHNAFDWGGDDFHPASFNDIVIYELHVGTFNKTDGPVGTLDSAIERLDHVQDLGANCVELMPVMEFAGDQSWGYNPSDPFTVESAYGGPDALKRFVKEAHARGIAVIVDVVYNHFGPSDLDLWTFDGWSGEDGKGGIYFYNDWRSATPWGDTRPDYGREEVRRYIIDNAWMWLEKYHVDGLRLDMTPYMHSGNGGATDIPEGWAMLRRISDMVRKEFPGRIVIAEDLHNNAAVTSTGPDGAGFHAQWDARFVHPVREALTEASDDFRSIAEVVDAVTARFSDDAFTRVIYTESHDEVANGRARVPQEIDPTDAAGWAAQKRSTVGAALALTSPGIPMLFQGQEFLEGAYFRDGVPLDWARDDHFEGIANLYRDLVNLRLNRAGHTKGLMGQNVEILHADDDENLLVYRRWMDGGPGDDTLVVVNLSNAVREKFDIGLPSGPAWKLRFNSDARLYSSLFGDFHSYDMEAYEEDFDGQPFHGNLSIAPYTVLIYSQD